MYNVGLPVNSTATQQIIHLDFTYPGSPTLISVHKLAQFKFPQIYFTCTNLFYIVTNSVYAANYYIYTVNKHVFH